MTIQDGDINKHLDNKPPKDKWFIWCVVIIVVMISALLVVLFKPEIFTNILDKIIPTVETEDTSADEYDDGNSKEYISKDLVLQNISKDDAIRLYEIAHIMSELLINDEYFFGNEIENKEWTSILTDNPQNLAVWFTLYIGYNDTIPLKTSNTKEMSSFDDKVEYRKETYKLTNKQFAESSLEENYYRYFSNEYTYKHENSIEYSDCYLAVYYKNISGYVIYQKTENCNNEYLDTSYKLTKAEYEDDGENEYIYLYEKNKKNEFMYTFVKEDNHYKFLLRTNTKSVEKEENNTVISEDENVLPEENPEEVPTDENPSELPTEETPEEVNLSKTPQKVKINNYFKVVKTQKKRLN